METKLRAIANRVAKKSFNLVDERQICPPAQYERLNRMHRHLVRHMARSISICASVSAFKACVRGYIRDSDSGFSALYANSIDDNDEDLEDEWFASMHLQYFNVCLEYLTMMEELVKNF